MSEWENPIGVFDSGIGGLSVAAAIRELMPRESIVYVGDSAHVPYGGHDSDFIRDRAAHISRFLLREGARAIVIACNTATAASATDLRAELSIPVVGMEPAVKPAAAVTKSGVVGVLATAGTLASARFAGLLDRFGEGVRVLTEPCPDLVGLVERGEISGRNAHARVAGHVRPLTAAGADTLILGCTHFSFLQPLIREAAGREISIIDTGPAVARQLRRRLAETAGGAGGGALSLYTSGDPDRFTEVARRLWPGAPRARRLD